MRSYRDFCRPARPVEHTEKKPGDRVLINAVAGVEIVRGEPVVVAIGRRKGRGRG